MERSQLIESKEYIYNHLDLSMLIKKLTHKSYLGDRWHEEDAKIGINLYKNFLYLSRKFIDTNELIIPSEEIDEIWHNHILDTKKYHKDCQHIFGEYLHHYPYFGMDDNSSYRDLTRSFEKSQQLYFQEFGEYY